VVFVTGAKVVFVTGAKVAQPIIPKPVKSPISMTGDFFLFLRNKNKKVRSYPHCSFLPRKEERTVGKNKRRALHILIQITQSFFFEGGKGRNS
jgi:hypothetical protein